jgi:gluconolactonase
MFSYYVSRGSAGVRFSGNGFRYNCALALLMKFVPCAAIAALLILPFAGAQQPSANTPATLQGGAGGASGSGGRGPGGAPQPPLPFMIHRFDPALDSVIAPDAKTDTIVTIPGLSSEGPMWREAKLWFSDQRGGNIYTVTLDGKTTVVAEMAGGQINPQYTFNQGPNALAMDKDGSILVCRQAIRDIGRMKADGTIVEAYARYNGKRFNAPNDMVFALNGTLWFTDPTFSLPGARGSGGEVAADSQFPIEGVYSVRNGKVTQAITDLALPNGIGVSPDGKTLYVGTSSKPRIRAYDIAADDSLSNGRDFTDFGIKPEDNVRGYVDGLKVDSAGNVWSTGPGGVTIVSPAGKVLGRIQLPQSSNVAFGGDDYKSVFFTSGNNILRMHILVPGLKPMYAKP